MTGKDSMENVTIRMASEQDAEALVEIYRPYVEETAITFEYDTPSPEEFRGRIREVLKKFPYLVAEWNGEPVGYAYVHPFKERAAYDWAVETSVYVRQEVRGRGIGKQLYAKLEELLTRQHITNLNACITYPNPDSIAFHERLGYKKVAHFTQCGYKFDRWYDMIWMEKMLCQQHPQRPESVLPIGQVVQDIRKEGDRYEKE